MRSHKIFSLLLACIILFPITLNAQLLFEEGFYIDLNNTPHKGFITRTFNTTDQPGLIFKKSRRTPHQQLDPTQVKSVYVSGLQLTSFEVFLDTTAAKISELREPLFEARHLFLESIIEGTISLYKYNFDGIVLFFIWDKESEKQPEQLIYKQYNGPRGLYNNNSYRDQLVFKNECSSEETSLDEIRYTESQLSQYVAHLNDCINSTYQQYTGLKYHSWKYLNISILSGLRWSEITSKERVSEDELFTLNEFEVPNLGLEFEYLLSATQNRLAPIFRAELARSSMSSTIDLPSGTQNVVKNLNYVYLTLGMRAYFSTNTPIKFYIDAGIANPYPIEEGISLDHEKRIDFEYTADKLIPSLGVGFILYNRFSVDSKLEFLNTRISKNNSFNDISYTAFTINLKLFLKSYYSLWEK